MARRIRVVAALISSPDDSARFLVQQRLPNVSRANLWEFPGGKVETGESDELALARECTEELMVELRVGRKVWSTTHEYADLTVELLLYRATIIAGTPQSAGAQQIRFCTPAEMKTLEFCEADVPLVDDLSNGSLDI
jgi:8-oxo-dGTP diphosphatase